MRKGVQYLFLVIFAGMYFVGLFLLSAAAAQFAQRLTVGIREYSVLMIYLLIAGFGLFQFSLGEMGLSESRNRLKKYRFYFGPWTKMLLFLGVIVTLALNLGYTSYLIDNNPTLNRGEVSLKVYAIAAALFAALVLFLMNQNKQHQQYRDRMKRSLYFVLNGKRRYSMVIAKTQHNLCSGFVHGKIMKDDVVAVHCAGRSDVTAIVEAMQFEDKDVSVAADCYVSVRLKFEKPHPLVKFGVITSYLQSDGNNEQGIVENPGLDGLLKDYARFIGDHDYFGALIYEVCHSQYYLPKTSADAEMGQYMSVHLNIDPQKNILVLFTDINALYRLGNVSGDKEIETAILNLPECFALIGRKYKAIVINPFGPKAFYINGDLMKEIQNLPGYQEEYREK